MKALSTSLLAIAAALAFGGVAAAQESPVKEPAEAAGVEDSSQIDDGGLDISFNVGVSTDYVFRGISQTNENGQLFGGVDLTFGNNNYAGIWASNIDYSEFGDDDTNAEIDYYIGVKPEVNGFVFDFALIYYTYLNQPNTIGNYNYVEVKGAISRAIGPATVGAAVYYSPEFSGETGEAVYSEINGAYTINDRLSVSGAVGQQNLSFDAEYSTGNIGATVVLTPNVGLDLRYHTTDAGDSFVDAYDDRFVASLKATF